MKAIQLPDMPAQGNFDSVDPIDGRYYDPEIAKYLSERSRIAFQAHMEGALAQTLAEFGICNSSIAAEIETAAAGIKAEAVREAELITKHDIKAIVDTIKKDISNEAKPYVHFGATSYDIVSSASALQFRTAITDLVVPRLHSLLRTLLKLTDDYADTVQVGRTHGQHAVPITFGFLMAEYVSRLGESTEALQSLSNELRGKFSGAVGAYNALSVFTDDPIKFEQSVLAKVDLQPAPYSKQVVPAENVVRLIDELAITAGIMANLSHDMRHLQRTEIAEVREKFEKGQTGSSTMAHKRNPWNFENVISMSKQVTAQIINANLNITSEHQRDLTDSASARFYMIVFASVASMTARLDRIMSKLEVDTEAMQKNLKMTGGAIAAEPLYLLLEKYGHTEAHEAAKELAHKALKNNTTLYEALLQSKTLKPYVAKLSKSEKKLIESPETAYSGLASQRAQQIYTDWSQRLT